MTCLLINVELLLDPFYILYLFFLSLSPCLGFVNYMDTSEFDSWCLGGLRACLKEFAFGFLWVVVCTDDGGWVAFSVV